MTEADRLAAVRSTGLLDTAEEPAFDEIALIASVVCDAPIALVSLVDERRCWFKARHGLDAAETPREGSFCSHTIMGEETLIVRSATVDQRFAKLPIVAGPPAVRFYAGAPIVTRDGMALGTVCVLDVRARDLAATPRRVLESLARLAAAQIDARRRSQDGDDRRRDIDRLKDEFVATVSHELRTPLTSIRGALGLLAGNAVAEIPAPARELVDIARSNTDRLMELVGNVIDLERVERGQLDLTMHDIAPGVLVASAVSAMATVAERAGVTIVTEIATEDHVLADLDRAVQVLMNFLSNAIKASPEKGRVGVRAMRENARVRFSVTDKGPGIAPNRVNKLFERFQPLDASNSRRHGGVGLGLALARALAERQGGAVGVDTIPGAGSTFWFELRLAEPMPVEAIPEELRSTAPTITEVLEELRGEYIAALPRKLDELEQALSRAQALPDSPSLWEDARMKAHALRGTSGSYGFDAISEAAGRIEDALTIATDDDPTMIESAWQIIDAAVKTARSWEPGA